MSYNSLDFKYICKSLAERDYLIHLFKKHNIHIKPNNNEDNLYIFPNDELVIEPLFDWLGNIETLFTRPIRKKKDNVNRYYSEKINNSVDLITRINILFGTTIDPYINTSNITWIKRQ